MHTLNQFSRSFKLLKLHDIIKFQELKFYYKYKNIKLSYYLQNMPFHPNTDTQSYPTRIQHNLHQHKTKHEYAKQCIQYDIPITINNFPREVLDKIDTQSSWLCWLFLRHIYSKHIKKFVQLLTVIYVTDKWFNHPPPMSK